MNKEAKQLQLPIDLEPTLPKLGETRSAKEIGYKGTSRYIWHACEDCKKEQWGTCRHGKAKHLRCRLCSNKAKAKPWKENRFKTDDGYIMVKLMPNDFFYSMASKDAYVLEHRFIMAQHLGRCLQPWELVHHKDGIKDHNDYNNLRLTIRGSHTTEHSKGYRDGYRQGLADGRMKQIEELRQEIRLLQWQIKEKEESNART